MTVATVHPDVLDRVHIPAPYSAQHRADQPCTQNRAHRTRAI